MSDRAARLRAAAPVGGGAQLRMAGAVPPLGAGVRTGARDLDSRFHVIQRACAGGIIDCGKRAPDCAQFTSLGAGRLRDMIGMGER